MTYKEALLFIGKCLTISHEEKNLIIVSKKITSQKVDWDTIVKVSTQHFVFPTLYSNLKKAQLLSYLPEELVSYMEHIIQLNRERNLEILEQAKELNEFLINHGVTPIFLKGTGFLLQNIYDDIGERMVGDIDILVSEKEFEKSIKLLIDDGYEAKKNDNSFFSRHYPKLVKPKMISSVEIHHRMTPKSYSNHFNYNTIKTITIKNSSTKVLSIEDQILHVCFNKQINDFGQWYKSISLRNSYDLFTLSKSKDPLKTIKHFQVYFKFFNNFLASTEFFLNSHKLIKSEKTKNTSIFLKTQIKFIDNPNKSKRNRLLWDFVFTNKNRCKKFAMFFYNKKARKYFLDRFFSRSTF